MNRVINLSTHVLAILWALPLFGIIYMAFKDTKVEGFSVTIHNFIEAWNSAPFAQYYLNTFIIVIGILAVQLVTITLAAYVFARMNFVGQGIVFLLYLVQIMIPIELLIFPNSSTIAQLGIYDTKLAIMIPYFISAFGIFLLRQTFKGIPYELEEAAKMEGCNRIQTIWHVYVPLAKPTYIAFGLISVSGQWSNFLWPLIITDSDSNRPLTVGLAMFAKASDSGAQWGVVAAATLFVILPLLLAFFLFQRQFISSFMHSGIK
ncbi:sn-glycerol 3-phosphate transport system permease protein [Cerasibacillus quisquiliarum]|uniref:ABC transporter permease n=1 Tax=Cerasibacillus quisquiliarum TaxID=227865 RepID=A0A511UU37_9BACI|nr:carbohydrate ABC transporter permease [Cerasibacillus quisquiliarum]MBB5144995.1 sn-glycerol 3-phosphate transport system permease protein [Cerasibacillus quisquiliarum]GEN30110.1 ABC transporter permease [Cerasibacillus quisquiliarum]